MGAACTITLSSPLNPAADGGRVTAIDGGGAHTITLNGNNAIQLLHVGVGAAIAANNLNFTGGNDGGGGASFVDNGGTLTLTNCALFGNTGGNGGALYVNTGGLLNLTNVTISGNSTTSFGTSGGIYSFGTVTATNCTITKNSARNYGGVSVGGGSTFTTRNTIIAGNTSTVVGGDAFGSFTSLGNNIMGNNTGKRRLQRCRRPGRNGSRAARSARHPARFLRRQNAHARACQQRNRLDGDQCRDLNWSTGERPARG